MSLPVVMRRVARGEYDVAIDWHEEAKPGLGVRFEAAVEAAIQDAATQPTRFPVADGDIREVVVDGFPYCLYYRVRSGQLIVLGVYHQSRDPNGWRGR